MTDSDASLLVDLGPTVFVPAERNPCWRWWDYYKAFILDNSALQASIRAERSLTRMTQGQRLAYVLGSFDDQVLNGGVAQFLFNCGELAQEVLTAFRHLGLSDAEALLSAAVAQADPEGLVEARRVFSEEVAKSGSGANARARAAYERERLRVERAAKVIEDGWYPKWNEELDPPTEGPLRTAMCEAMNAYIAAHPGEFQVLKS